MIADNLMRDALVKQAFNRPFNWELPLGSICDASSSHVPSSHVPTNGVEVIMTRLDADTDAVWEAALLLSDDERRRAQRFAFDRDRRRFILARSRLRQLLGARLQVTPNTIRLAYGKRGKPVLAMDNADLDIRFNVSHCQNIAVYAFATGLDVGIDVEAIRLMRYADDIMARFFSVHENEAYQALDLSQRPRGFFNCWTRKEAFVKALGDGFYHELDAFDVTLAPDVPAQILRVASKTGEACGWALNSFSPGRGLIGAVAVQRSIHETTAPPAMLCH